MTLDEVERQIGCADIPEARLALRGLLFAEVGATLDGSVADAIARLASDPMPHPAAAAYVLRCLSIPSLIPQATSKNEIARHVVTLCEQSLPELCRFFRLAEYKQTFQKFGILLGAHAHICGLLRPLQDVPRDMNGFLASKSSILQSLNHGIVKSYCAAFRMNEVRFAVESLFSRLARLTATDANIVTELRGCADAFREQPQFCEQTSVFLVVEFYRPFLASAESAVRRFVEEARGRFLAPLSDRLPPTRVLLKRQALREIGRELTLAVPLRNDGPGTAIGVTARLEIDSGAVVLDSNNLLLGNVLPGDFSAVFNLLVVEPSEGFLALLTLSWEEAGDPERKSLVLEFNVLAHKTELDWSRLKYERPYSPEVAKGAAFVGRKEKVLDLANRLLSTPMRSFYVTGQKRVGKTSLVLAAVEFAKAAEQGPGLSYCYLLWGRIAYEDPRKSLRELGDSISAFIRETFPHDVNIPPLDFIGSLAPLTRLAEIAAAACPGRKYVIIIDEFDEMPPELYMQGNLAETFFANIRALATCDNICTILIGGENMSFVMDRQGQKLNKFARVGLDYYSRDIEWDDFKLLVQTPTEGRIDWHDDAIADVFNISNGNPYFAKVVCARVFIDAVAKHDADIILDDIRQALAIEVPSLDTNSFAHLWQDGIHKAAKEKEPDILRRCRLLVAIARVERRRQAITVANILSNKQSSLLSDTEVQPLLNEFIKRDILREKEGNYQFVLPIFGSWLRDVGIGRLASDTLSEELARSVEAAEDAAYIHSNEIAVLARSWPTYQGRVIGTDEIRSWYEQVQGHQNQRLLFKLLLNVRVFSEVQIREKLRTIHSFIRPSLPEFVAKKRSDRRTDVVITYVDGEGKSGQYYAARYAEENGLSSRSIIPPSNFSHGLREHIQNISNVAAILVVDDIVATGRSLARDLIRFFEDNDRMLRLARVITVALTATSHGEGIVRAAMSKIDGIDCDLRVCEPLTERGFAFEKNNGIWIDDDEADRAKALCTDLGVNIYRDNPLGFGNQGLLIVFPMTCPNNSLPILHSAGQLGSGKKWTPLFPRLVS